MDWANFPANWDHEITRTALSKPEAVDFPRFYLFFRFLAWLRWAQFRLNLFEVIFEEFHFLVCDFWCFEQPVVCTDLASLLGFVGGLFLLLLPKHYVLVCCLGVNLSVSALQFLYFLPYHRLLKFDVSRWGHQAASSCLWSFSAPRLHRHSSFTLQHTWDPRLLGAPSGDWHFSINRSGRLNTNLGLGLYFRTFCWVCIGKATFMIKLSFQLLFFGTHVTILLRFNLTVAFVDHNVRIQLLHCIADVGAWLCLEFLVSISACTWRWWNSDLAGCVIR